ncbi:MAG: histidine phosphatase family protein, partial [Actinomycetota bacterium]
RVVPAVERFLDDASWDVGLLVLHGAVNRAIISWALLDEPSFLGGFEQAPGCINVLDVDGERRFVVRAVNHTPYDPTHAAAPRETTMEQLWREYLERQ